MFSNFLQWCILHKKNNLVNETLDPYSEKETTPYRDESNREPHTETNTASGMSSVLAVQPSPLMTSVFVKNIIKCQIPISG